MGRRGRSASATASPLDSATAEALADAMFALSTPNRIQILFSLLDRPYDVSELVDALGMEQSAVSHQLRVLREQDLVRVERDGSRRVYALADEYVLALLHQARRHVEHRADQRGLLKRAPRSRRAG
jgi:DNA-binding transcriptional ArsR family regulator